MALENCTCDPTRCDQARHQVLHGLLDALVIARDVIDKPLADRLAKALRRISDGHDLCLGEKCEMP